MYVYLWDFNYCTVHTPLNNTLGNLISICLFDPLVIVFQYKNININQQGYKYHREGKWVQYTLATGIRGNIVVDGGHLNS